MKENPSLLEKLLLPTLKAATDRVLSLGIEAAPEEACGLLIPESGGFRVIQMINRADDPTISYRIDAKTVQQLSLDPETWGEVAIWHTHPRGNVGPSSGDLEYQQPGVKYVVVTVPTGEVVWF